MPVAEESPANNALYHFLTLRQLKADDDLFQWRRAIVELRILEAYKSFFLDVAEKRCTDKKRTKGMRNISEDPLYSRESSRRTYDSQDAGL